MPLVTVTGAPTPPAGRSLAAGTVLAVRYDEPYVDGINAYTTLYQAEIDLTNNAWKPQGEADGTAFRVPAGADGYPRPPVAWLVEKQVLDDASEIRAVRGPLRIYQSATDEWAYGTPAPDAIYMSDPSVSSSYVPTTRVVGSGTGLEGGGDLSADRTLAIADGGVDTLQLAAAAVATAKLADTAVTPAKASRIGMRTVTADTTLQASDLDGTVRVNDSSAHTVTIPSGTFSDGAVIEVMRYGSGAVTVAPGSGVTLNSPDGQTGSRDISQQYASAFARHITGDTWVLQGDLA